MSPAPLVSIAMPCYNSARTLPMALASLLAQTYENWECLLVDDGSTDRPGEIVERAADPRIRLIRLERNQGRGIARQVAIERAEGDLLGMLDADDWYYPSKLAEQVEFLAEEPGVVLVGAGMAIVGPDDELMGVRCCGQDGPRPLVVGPRDRLAPPAPAHAPSLIRMAAAKQAGYDSTLNLGEDVDFLLRVLTDRSHAILPSPAYAYAEPGSVDLAKVMGGQRAMRRIFRKYQGRFPVSSRLRVAESFAKEFVYRAGFALGLGERLIARRSRGPTLAEVSDFGEARTTVAGLAARLSDPIRSARRDDCCYSCGDRPARPSHHSARNSP